MWTGGAMWMWPAPRPTSSPRRPSTVDLALSKTRHPSFSPELAENLVAELSRRQLRLLWDATGRQLREQLSHAHRLNVVVLREHVLRELERHHPATFEACLRSARGQVVRRRRADRS